MQLHFGRRVSNLGTERANGKIRPLWNIEESAGFGACELPAVDGPESCEHAEEGAFATPVGTSDEDLCEG